MATPALAPVRTQSLEGPSEPAPAARRVQALAVGGLTGPDALRRLFVRLAAIPGVRGVVADFGDVTLTPVLIAYADVARPARAMLKSAVCAEVRRCGLTVRTPSNGH